MLRPLRDDAPAGTGRNRAELQSVPRSGGESRRPRESGPTLSLHAKIFLGYLVLGAILFGTSRLLAHFGVTHLVLEAAITLTVAALFGVLLPSSLAKVSRVRMLNRSALEISRGNLSKPVQIQEAGLGRDEIDELALAIAHMQENLRELVGHVQRTSRSVADSANDLQHSAENVNGSTEEVAESMEKINRGADEQTRLVERASGVITAMASSIERASRSAEDAARSAADTSGAAEFSGNAARLAGEKVKKVFSRIENASKEVFAFGEKTQEISKIVDAITNVAQQTNLLALNATIEAARAGEYGRGFAVVAEEVRKLAETAGRSAEAISRISREIAGQASAVVGAMKEGIEELGDGREDLNNIIRALEAITDTARKAAERVNSISELSRDQLDGSAEMVKAIEHISGVARSNASLTEAVHAVIQEQTAAVAQMTSSAQELTNLSLELQTVVTRFRL
ncbi:MAG: methyl-accepting chemotaxis protein [Myxococcales bacterium]